MQPLELYPPVMNFLKVLSSHGRFNEVEVYSTSNNRNNSFFKLPETSHIKIYRTPYPKKRTLLLNRLIKYLWFNLRTFIGLAITRPSTVFYYESMSAIPAYFYFKLFRKISTLYIHYHEYTSLSYYAKEMRMIRYAHNKEVRFLYEIANGVSHTNDSRVELFKKDYKCIAFKKLTIMPNYPLSSWAEGYTFRKYATDKLKLVYIGSLSASDTYVIEICKWVCENDDKLQLDIFSFNIETKLLEDIKAMNSDVIKIDSLGIEYYEIAHRIRDYDIGLILYKGVSENYIHNVPNKFFEYYTAGLDIWYPKEMIEIDQFITEDTYPCVRRIDFQNLQNLSIPQLVRKDHFKNKQMKFHAEDIYKKFINLMYDRGY